MEAKEKQVPATQDKGSTTYMVAGQEVKLSFDIVRRYLARGNSQVTDAEMVLFISICKFNQLNPFLNEAYLIKYGGQNPTAQMVVSKEALMKRAEVCPEYEGFQAGLIVKRGGDIIDVEGSFLLTTDVLLGGWARVYRADRKYPFTCRVSLSEYDKGQSLWSGKKATMVRKTAIVQAMREAFPAQLGAMYTAEERGVEDVTFEDVSDKVEREKAVEANKTVIGFEQAVGEKKQPESSTPKSSTPESNTPESPNNGQPQQPQQPQPQQPQAQAQAKQTKAPF